MDEAGIDVLLATSKHNVQYLLGGHRAIFFDYMDAMGLSRYLPIMVYPKGDAGQGRLFRPSAGEFPAAGEAALGRRGAGQFAPVRSTRCEKATEYLRRAGVPAKRIGIETTFMPMDAGDGAAQRVARQRDDRRAGRAGAPAPAQVAGRAGDAARGVREGDRRHDGDDRRTSGPGTTKAEITETLRREEVNRGLTFEYCLIAAGKSHNRAPSEQRWEEGDVLSIDSGGNYHGYIGDLARMAILGEPDAELEDLLGEIETIQRAAFKPIRAGAMGGEIYAAGEALVAKSKQHNNLDFLAHGMGLVSHEAPHLTNHGPVPYTDEDAHRPLETGMVISVETTLKHPARGFIKLEDTVVVTDTGFEIFGEGGRGWNRGGTALRQ